MQSNSPQARIEIRSELRVGNSLRVTVSATVNPSLSTTTITSASQSPPTTNQSTKPSTSLSTPPISVIVTTHEINELHAFLSIQSAIDPKPSELLFSSLPELAQLFLILTNLIDWTPNIYSSISDLVDSLCTNDPEKNITKCTDSDQNRMRILQELTSITFANLSPDEKPAAAIRLRALISENQENPSIFSLLKPRCNLLLSSLLFSLGKFDESLQLLQTQITSLEYSFAQQQQQQSKGTASSETSNSNEVTPASEFHLFNSYINITQHLSRIGDDTASMKYLSKAKKLIVKLFPSVCESQLYTSIVDLNLANIAQDEGRIRDAISILRECLSLLAKLTSDQVFASRATRLSAQVHNNLSTCLSAQEEFDVSLKHALQSLKMNETYFGINSTSTELAKSLMNVAQIYSALDLTEQAAAHAFRAEKIFESLSKKNNNNTHESSSTTASTEIVQMHAICLGSIAAIFSGESKDELKKACAYLEKSIAIFETIPAFEISIDYMTALLSYSRVHFQIKNHEKCIEIAKKSLALLKAKKDDPRTLELEAACFESISEAYRELGDIDSSIDYLYDAVQIYEKLDPNETLLLAYSNMALMWQEKRDDTESAYYLAKVKKLERLLGTG